MFLNLTTAPCLLVLFLFFLVILLFHCLLSAIVYCLQAVLVRMTLYHYFLSFRNVSIPDALLQLLTAWYCMQNHLFVQAIAEAPVGFLSVFLCAVLAWSILWRYSLCFTAVAMLCMCVLLCMPSYRYCRMCSLGN